MEPLNGADCGVSFKRFDIMPTADVLSCFIGYAFANMRTYLKVLCVEIETKGISMFLAVVYPLG